MNKIYKLLFLLSIVATIFTACSPESFALGGQDVKSTDLVEGIAYKIEHDATNPNIVYLTSLMGSKYTPLWNHPQGRSQEQKVTLKIPFAGTYKVQFGVETRGGVVYGDTVTFKVDNMYAGFISNELWTKLSGGANQEKTWYLDINSSSVSKFFGGPLFFFGTYDSWETVTNGVKAPAGADSWNWSPKYTENTWLLGAADFGSMTFDLKNGAHVKVDHKTIAARGTENGLYMLDTDNHSLKLTGASILHDIGRDAVVTQWGNCKILSLTENTMQLAVLRDNDPKESKCLLVYNFISKSYSDNWKPIEVKYAEPIKTTFKQSDLVGTWKYNLVNESWIGWEIQGSKKGGALLNNWPTRTAMLTDLVSWGGSASTITNADNNLYVFNADGTCTLNGVNNTYTVANGTITFGTALTGTEWNLIYITFTGKTVNVLNVTSRDSKPYTSSGIWLGQRNGTKEEDSSVQLVKQY